jgi:hypothetical protein
VWQNIYNLNHQKKDWFHITNPDEFLKSTADLHYIPIASNENYLHVQTTGFCSLAGVKPELKNVIGANAQRLGCGQDKGTIITILPDWWNMYERLTFDLLSHAISGPVPYCRIPAP